MGQSDYTPSHLEPQAPIYFWYNDSGWHEAKAWCDKNGIKIQATDSIQFIQKSNEAYHKAQQVVNDKRT